jgi:hypothetical protein
MKKEQVHQQALLGGETQQNQAVGGGAMRDLRVEFIRLHERTSAPSVPWEFVVEWPDYFWPVKWSLFPLGEGDLWLVKKESPWNELAKEKAEVVGIAINGELVFAEYEWNNETLQVWDRESVLSLFEKVRRGEYSGVVIEENCDEEEREEAERLIRLLYLIRQLLEDEERISEYGEITFRRYAERYYSEELEEFRDFFEELAKLEGKERIKYLKSVKRDLNKRLYETGFFMHIYYL